MINPEEINLVVNVANVALEVDVATPCSLIINELLSNALKHAFPGGTAVSGRRPEIRIMLHPVDGNCALVVSDNGVGLPADLDPCSTTSLGLQIVEVLTRQLKGTIEVDRQGGTAFKITFPWSQGPRTTARSLSD
jgi:two-component sensor histidine kinase